MEKLAKGLGIYHKTVFTGARPHEEIPIYYQLGDIFVSASQSETQGLTYIEALASGLPVVAKEDRCLDGVIKNGINGYTFQDQEDFIQALDRILSDPRHKEQLSLGAVGSAKKFSASCFSDSVEDLYRNILNDSVLNLRIG